MNEQLKNILLEEKKIIEEIKNVKPMDYTVSGLIVNDLFIKENHNDHKGYSMPQSMCKECKKVNPYKPYLSKFKNIIFKKKIIIQGLYYKTEKEYYLDYLLKTDELLRNIEITNFNTYIVEDITQKIIIKENN